MRSLPTLATYSHIVQVVLNAKERFGDGWLRTQQQLLGGSSNSFKNRYCYPIRARDDYCSKSAGAVVGF